MMLRGFSAVALCAVASISTAARAEGVLIVGVGADAANISSTVQQALPPSVVLADPTPLMTLLSSRGVRIEMPDAQVAFEQASAADPERSTELLDTLIGTLEADVTFSTEKFALLQQARLLIARQLMGIAGPGETGKGETKNGAKAKGHLAAAVRSDPTLVLDDSASPKLRALLSLAADEVKRGGHGALQVTSQPSQASVILEGRAIGLTPLRTTETIASGTYRLWLEKDGVRNALRPIVIGDAPVSVTSSIAIESIALVVRERLVTTKPAAPLSSDDVAAFAASAGAAHIAFVGKDDEVGDYFVVVTDSTGAMVSSAREKGLRDLAAALDVHQRRSPPPSWLFHEELRSAAAGEEPPWVLIGAVAGGVVVVAGAVLAGVLIAQANATTFVTVRVSEGAP